MVKIGFGGAEQRLLDAVEQRMIAFETSRSRKIGMESACGYFVQCRISRCFDIAKAVICKQAVPGLFAGSGKNILILLKTFVINKRIDVGWIQITVIGQLFSILKGKLAAARAGYGDFTMAGQIDTEIKEDTV